MINTNGNKPRKKNTILEAIMLNVNPLNILSNICPESIFAANLSPKDTFLAKYDINSIITNKGKSPKGQPAGTKREKNFNPCFWKLNIVAPSTIVKLNENVNIK